MYIYVVTVNLLQNLYNYLCIRMCKYDKCLCTLVHHPPHTYTHRHRDAFSHTTTRGAICPTTTIEKIKKLVRLYLYYVHSRTVWHRNYPKSFPKVHIYICIPTYVFMPVCWRYLGTKIVRYICYISAKNISQKKKHDEEKEKYTKLQRKLLFVFYEL